MDEARAVLARLERIEALDRSGAAPDAVLSELRELVQEAQAWARRERDPRAEQAARALAEAATVPASRPPDRGARPAGIVARVDLA